MLLAGIHKVIWRKTVIKIIPFNTKKEVIRLLGTDGHRLIAQKHAVLNVLFEQDWAHVTVEQIYGYAKNIPPEFP